MSGGREADRSVRDSYDRVPYPAAAQPQTHPDHLAVLAWMHGLDPPPPDRCRVLELGCADGGNLIAMAPNLPGSRFTGVDLSPRQIEDGLAAVRDLGMDNVELRAMSLLDVDAGLGTFDYILCHGVYSWVTDEVREKILAVCRAHLAPNGIAYVSYNTYPGWYMRGIIRDALLFHTRGIEDPEAIFARAAELVRFLADAASTGDDAHAALMRTALADIEENRFRPTYLIHEYLERDNQPLYFRDFAAAAARHGLEVLCEADPHLAELEHMALPAAERIRTLTADRIDQQQYLDFALNRTFRRTLLTREAAHSTAMVPERMARLCAATPAIPEGDKFRMPNGSSFSASHPLAAKALAMLASAWPRAIPFGHLLSAVGSAPNDAFVLADILHSLYWSEVVTLHLVPPPCVAVAGERPRVTPLVRWQAARGRRVTTQRHATIDLDDPLARSLVQQLDGTRDRAALLRLVEMTPAALEEHLARMARHALLVG